MYLYFFFILQRREYNLLIVFIDLKICLVTNPPTRKIGSVADIDPVNEYYGSLTPAMNNNHMPQHQQPAPANTLVLLLFFIKTKYQLV